MIRRKRIAAVTMAILMLFVTVANVSAGGDWNQVDRAKQESDDAKDQADQVQQQVVQNVQNINKMVVKIRTKNVEVSQVVRQESLDYQNESRQLDQEQRDFAKEVSDDTDRAQKMRNKSIEIQQKKKQKNAEHQNRIRERQGEQRNYTKQVTDEIRAEQQRLRESIRLLAEARREYIKFIRETMRQCSQITPRVFLSDLSGFEEVPPVDTRAHGMGVFQLTNDCSGLQYVLVVNNIEGATQAHLHKGAIGQNGPIIVTLYPGPEKSGKFSGRLSQGFLRPDNLSGDMNGMGDFIRDLQAGDVYANVHTTSHMDGEIRGQLLQPGQKRPKPTQTPAPTKTPKPTATPKPTHTGTPGPTVTPPPGGQTITLNWHLVGEKNVPEEAYKSVPSDILKGKESITLVYNLHGNCAGAGDASGIIFDQDGWKYVSLSQYGKKCFDGEQSATIPLSNFQGLDTNEDLTGSFHVRFWFKKDFEVDIKSVTFNSGPSPTATASPSPTATHTPTPTATPSLNTVEIRNNAYNPQEIHIAKGATVTWSNKDTSAHTVTSDTGIFNSGNINPNSTFKQKFNQNGTYNYHCTIHPDMHGSVVVGNTTPTPTPTSTATPKPPETVTLNWHLDGATGGTLEATAPIRPDILMGRTKVRITYDAHGYCLNGADASAIAFDQDGWKYISLANYGDKCKNGEQTVNIPLSDFSGLNTNANVVGTLHGKFWNESKYLVDVESIEFRSD